MRAVLISTQKPIASIVIALGLLAAWLCWTGSTGAAPAQAKPLAVKGFTFETTRTEKTTSPLGHENWGFVNRPAPYTEAGGHLDGSGSSADALTSTIELESELVKESGGNSNPVPTQDPRDIVVNLPTGLLGNPTATPRCPLKLVLNAEICPSSTQIGEAVVYLDHGEGLAGPIVNVVPEAGQSAEFALENDHHLNFLLTAHVVRTKEGYGITVVTNSIPQAEIYKVQTSFWGVPAAKVHDRERGVFCERTYGATDLWRCQSEKNIQEEAKGEESIDPETPFLTWPSDCAEGPENAVLKVDSWEQPGHVGLNGQYEGYAQAEATLPAVTGCSELAFAPGLGVQPDVRLADSPVALGVNLTVPQVEKPEAPAVPEIRKSAITFPLGLSISPGIVDGIEACNERGPEGINFEGPESEEVGLNGELQLAPGHCPDASTVGTAEAVTPLLAEPIKGHVYLARPGCGGADQPACTEQDALDGNLYQLYLELGGVGKLASTGVNIKVRLKTDANPATGQLTAVAEEIAQLPFSELKVDLNGGPRAPLDTPPTCGRATSTADFTPWAAPGAQPNGVFISGLPDATPSSFFEVEGCGNPPGLSPGFSAGTAIPTAGRFSAFTMNLTREDREQYVKGIQVKTPPGLVGMLSNVPLCGEPQADQGTCPESSKIGTTRVASGAGSHPFEIEGQVYLTTAYRGAPFGLSIVTHAVAGPFNLGLVVVRARIDVDPTTSALTITTDETGPYAVPQILDGVPLRLRQIAVDVDRPDFMFNPTNCREQQITAAIAGTGQAIAHVASPFAAGACRMLAFKPSFTAQTNGRTSRSRGTSLQVRLSFPKGALGQQANIAKVKVELPRQLPAYLSTLQKACLAEVFDSNPAGCPPGSIVGVARTKTPVLPVELQGPVYFVSNGNAKFPSLIVVLQGDGVRVDLEGETLISKDITSSTFDTVPDVPVESFELSLPQGPDHALAVDGNLCKQQAQLTMPTTFWAQNGAVLHQNTKIAVSGCGKKRPAARKHRRRKGVKNRHAHAGRVRAARKAGPGGRGL